MVVGIIISAIVVMIIFGVLVSKRKKKDRQVLLDAVKKKDKETVQQLILKGVKVDGYYYGDENPLSIAVESNDIEMVSILLEKVYSINYSSKNPLFIAIQNDNKDIVSLLIEKGANVNYEKAICLVSAIKNKNKEIVELLIENGAEIDIDYGDETPLILAIKNNDIEIVSFLLEKGADPNFNVDEMPLDFAKNQQIYALLKNKGAKTSAELEEEKRAEEERKRLEAEEVLIKGCAYFNGDGVIQDYAKAVEFFEKAVELGNIRAYFYLALCYVEGKYVEKDVNKAIQLLMVSAEAGYMDAQLILGNLLYMKESSDEITERVYNVLMQNDASSWWRKAAEQGSDTAMYNLGSYYLELDILEDAGKWFEKAAANGNQKAFEKLKDLCSRGLYYVE